MARSEYKRFEMCYTTHFVSAQYQFRTDNAGNSFKIHFSAPFAQKLRGENYTVIFFYPGMFCAFFFSVAVSILIWAIRSRLTIAIAVLFTVEQKLNISYYLLHWNGKCTWVIRKRDEPTYSGTCHKSHAKRNCAWKTNIPFEYLLKSVAQLFSSRRASRNKTFPSCWFLRLRRALLRSHHHHHHHQRWSSVRGCGPKWNIPLNELEIIVVLTLCKLGSCLRVHSNFVLMF